MSHERRSVTELRTMAGLMDARRRRTSHGALLELSMLEVAKQRLTAERQRIERRCADIRKSIEEIDRKAQRLHRFVERASSGAPETAAAAIPLAIHELPPGKMKRRRLTY